MAITPLLNPNTTEYWPVTVSSEDQQNQLFRELTAVLSVGQCLKISVLVEVPQVRRPSSGALTAITVFHIRSDLCMGGAAEEDGGADGSASSSAANCQEVEIQKEEWSWQ
ncbi:hypothetical protein J6590_024842 [Homalodisca vitripennis]|nr:hypothetical protein J6590_024842 [Homalodisca vitripennis]